RWTGAGNEDSRAALHGVQPQRFGGGLQLNVHFHTLLLDGVFAAGEDGSLEFHAAEPPSDEEVARLLATIYRRVQRLLARRGLEAMTPPTSTHSPRNRPRWPASAAPRSRGGSRSGRAPAPACSSSAASPTPPGSPRAGRARRTSRASICTRASRWGPTTVREWSACAATCCARRWRRSASH